MKLDVGCGINPQGDVNCDLYVKDPIGHRYKCSPINTKKSKNFIVCDSEHLPFKSKAFDEVVSIHVIEHVKNPSLMLQEMLRVSNCKVLIRCPHKIGDGLHKPPTHQGYFNKRWFIEALARYAPCCKANITITMWKYFPCSYLPWIVFPYEITVTVEKCESC